MTIYTAIALTAFLVWLGFAIYFLIRWWWRDGGKQRMQWLFTNYDVWKTKRAMRRIKRFMGER